MNQIYIAGPFSTKEERDQLNQMIEQVKRDYPHHNLYIPMDHFIPGGNDKDENGNYIMPNDVWGKHVFNMDKTAIETSDFMVVLYRGRYSSTGTAWEIGYAYGIGVPIILYIPEDVDTTSLMVVNSAFKVIGNTKNQK